MGDILATLVKRISFMIIGIIMLVWSGGLLLNQVLSFPSIDLITVVVALFTFILGLRNAVSIYKDVSGGQVFLTILFVAVMVYIIWFM